MNRKQKNRFITGLLSLFLLSCFDYPEISAPRFIPKTPADSLIRRGINADPENAIYLEWEEPAEAAEEGILGYYLFRGKIVTDEYKFRRIANIKRNAGLLFDSDKYIDNSVYLDTSYYYYLKSYNDFTVSKNNSDTVCYKLARKATLNLPSGDICDNKPRFEFDYPIRVIDRISYLYLRLYYLEAGSYRIKFFSKIKRFDLSKSRFFVYLQGNDVYTTVLLDSLRVDASGKKYLEQGTYRWRIDAVSGELAGEPETEGSKSDWKYFTVK